MDEFVKSLNERQRADLGHNIISAIIADYSDPIKNGIANLLFEELSVEDDGEGFGTYCVKTASKVVAGQYDSLDEIQEEINELFEQEERQ